MAVAPTLETVSNGNGHSNGNGNGNGKEKVAVAPTLETVRNGNGNGGKPVAVASGEPKTLDHLTNGSEGGKAGQSLRSSLGPSAANRQL